MFSSLICLIGLVLSVCPQWVCTAPRDSQIVNFFSRSRTVRNFVTTLPEDGQSENNPLIILPSHVSLDMGEDDALISFLNRENISIENINHLRLNGFAGFIPTFIFRFVSLKSLDLSKNNLSVLSRRIGDLKELETLNLSKNALKQLPQELFDLERLEFLDLWDNQISQIDVRVKKLKKLNFLSIAGNPITRILDEIGQLEHLDCLYLINLEKLEDCDIPRSVYRLPCLESLSCYNTKISLSLRSGDFQRLSSLDLDSCGLKTLPMEFESLNALKMIDLSYNELDPDHLFFPPQLEKLILWEGLRDDEFCFLFPHRILSLKSLKHLDLSVCGIDAVPKDIAKLKNLEYLFLVGNSLEEVPDTISELRKLKILLLSHNDLKSLPMEIKRLNLSLVDVSGNVDFLVQGNHKSLGLYDLVQSYFVSWDIIWSPYLITDVIEALENNENLNSLECLAKAKKHLKHDDFKPHKSYLDSVKGLDENQAVTQIAFMLAYEAESCLTAEKKIHLNDLLKSLVAISPEEMRARHAYALMELPHRAVWADAKNVLFRLQCRLNQERRFGRTRNACLTKLHLQSALGMDSYDLMQKIMSVPLKRPANDLSAEAGPSKKVRIG